jgi:hypothetical protein
MRKRIKKFKGGMGNDTMSLIYSANMKKEYYVGKKIAVHQTPGGLEGIIFQDGVFHWKYDLKSDSIFFYPDFRNINE